MSPLPLRYPRKTRLRPIGSHECMGDKQIETSSCNDY